MKLVNMLYVFGPENKTILEIECKCGRKIFHDRLNPLVECPCGNTTTVERLTIKQGMSI